MTNQEQYEMICSMYDKYIKLRNLLYDKLMNISKEPESISKSARLSLIKCIIEEMEKIK